jgi:hypothetical protein
MDVSTTPSNPLERGMTTPLRAGRLSGDYRLSTNVPLATLGEACTTAARTRWTTIAAVRRRILDLAPPERRKLNGKLEDWHELDFPGFLAEVKRAFRVDIPLKKRGEWEELFSEERTKVEALTAEIEKAEREIDTLVYAAFELTPDEIALLERSLEGQR